MNWNADIIRNKEDGSYRTSISFDSRADCDVYGTNWKEMCAYVAEETGITFPAKKCLKFEYLSDW